MGDRAAQLKRLGYYKAFLKDLDKWDYTAESLKRVPLLWRLNVPGYDPESLERAAAFLELDHANPSHVSMLAHILADHVFGERKPGRQRGHATALDNDTKWELVDAYEDLRNRHPDCSELEIADLIRKIPKFDKYSPETIRVMLYEVMEEFVGSSDADSVIWKGIHKQVEDN